MTGILATTPDLMMVLGHVGITEDMRRFGRNMHNTEQGISRWNAIHPRLGRAAMLHAEQDAASHPFTYEYEPKPIEKLPDDAIFLMSGGLDSFASWRLLGQPRAVYFAIGHKAQEKELAQIEKIQEEFGGEIIIDRTLDLSNEEMSNGYIPYRNLYFLMMASKYSSNIVLSQIAEWAPDKNRGFYRQASKLLGKITTGSFQALDKRDIRVITPFSRYTKSQLIDRYVGEFGSAKDLVDYTTSCYSGTDIACGRCTSCASRHLAMSNNKVEEPYEETPNYDNFKKKVSVRDFKMSNVPMYIKRWLEMRGAR